MSSPEFLIEKKRRALMVGGSDRMFYISIGVTEAYTDTLSLYCDEWDAVATWWLKRNPSLLRSILSPEQVEAIREAEHIMVSRGRARFEPVKHFKHAKALKSLLGEEVAKDE